MPRKIQTTESGGEGSRHFLAGFGLRKNAAKANVNKTKKKITKQAGDTPTNMAIRKHVTFQDAKSVKKKTRQGCGTHSKGMKKYRGQGGPRKRVKQTNK